MDRSRFVIDESQFPMPQIDCGELVVRAEQFLETLSKCRSDSAQVFRISWLYECEIFQGVTLYSLLFESTVLDPDLNNRLRIAFDRCVPWDEVYKNASIVPVQLAGGVCSTTSASFAAGHVCGGKAMAVVPILDTAEAKAPPPINIGCSHNHLLSVICNQRCAVDFWRTVPEFEDLDEADFMAISDVMFPQTHFKKGLAAECRRFHGQWANVRPHVLAHLAVLNDYGRGIFERSKFDPAAVASGLASKGVDASLESPNTHRNAAAMKERDVNFDGVVIRCEWHTKIYPTVNRIHFHYGDDSIAESKILVGIFTDHLST